jgi:hypothetical protein
VRSLIPAALPRQTGGLTAYLVLSRRQARPGPRGARPTGQSGTRQRSPQRESEPGRRPTDVAPMTPKANPLRRQNGHNR